MIDGIYPSQFPELKALHLNHYKKLKKITNNTHRQISWFSSNFIQLSQRKKSNHENWKNYKNNKLQSERFKHNAYIFYKIQNIKSNYSLPSHTLHVKDPLLHHNYMYQYLRRSHNIQKNNRANSSRITNLKSSISHKKHQLDFRNNQQTVLRLQKFNRYKRLGRLASKPFINKSMNYFTKNSKTQQLQIPQQI